MRLCRPALKRGGEKKRQKASLFYPSADGTYIDPSCEGITNRRLLGRKVGWDWNSEFEFLAGLKEKMNKEISKFAPFGRDQNLKKMESFVYSRLLNDVRTFFQEKSKDFS